MDLFTICLQIFLFALILIEHRKIRELNQIIDHMFEGWGIMIRIMKNMTNISEDQIKCLEKLDDVVNKEGAKNDLG